MSKQVIVKKEEIPAGWSVEAADFINRLLIRKPANRLGLLGASEVKEHSWLKGFKWKDLYDKKMTGPFIPRGTDNFDSKYCNANERLTENTKKRYEVHLREEKIKQNFRDFEFNPNELARAEFINPHLKLSNTGEENILLERKENAELEKAYAQNNRIPQSMPTSSLIRQYQGKQTGIAYNKRNQSSHLNSMIIGDSVIGGNIKASGIKTLVNLNVSRLQASNNSYIANEMNNSAYLENS